MVFRPLLVAAAAVFLAAAPAIAADVNAQGSYGKVIRIDRNAFLPGAGLITFSEFELGAINPIYRPSSYGGPPNGITVTFGGFFSGQHLGEAWECPDGAVATGCVLGEPASPLRLDQNAPTTMIAEDNADPNSPSLSGSPLHNGPISMMFEPPVAGVGLTGGWFNAAQSTSIAAFDKNGNRIGGVVNLGTEMEYLALVTETGKETIAGLEFSLVGAEPAGFGIDDLSFAKRKDIQGAPGAEADVKPSKSISEVLSGLKSANPAKTPAKDNKKSITDILKKY